MDSLVELQALARLGEPDYTQSDTPHVAFDGATITAATTSIKQTITITGYTVATTDVCNALNITGGTNFTTGVYTINSVNAGLNTWTLDRNVASGVGAAMTGDMGGGFVTIGKAYGLATQYNSVWIKAGTFTITSTLTIPT